MLNMKCSTCPNESAVSLKYLQPLCRNCFCDVIEKRIRKHTRIGKAFRKGDRILIVDNLAKFIVKGIIRDLPAKVYYRQFSIGEIRKPNKELIAFISKNKINKIVIPWTADDDACSFMNSVFNNDNKAESEFPARISKKIVKLFSGITNKEAELYAKFNNHAFNPNTFYPDVRKFLDSLEELYPDTKFGIVKSREIYLRK